MQLGCRFGSSAWGRSGEQVEAFPASGWGTGAPRVPISGRLLSDPASVPQLEGTQVRLWDQLPSGERGLREGE